MSRVLVVEDEQDLATLLAFNLEQEGHEVETCGTGASGLAVARKRPADLVLLDLMLPDLSGLEVLKMLKGSPESAHTRVVIVTARGQEADRIAGLEHGADDYVVKPFSVKELLLRVRAVLRRAEEPASPPQRVLRSGEITVDVDRFEVTVGGAPVSLTALELRLLRTLLERAGRVQTREVLLADVWGIHAAVTTRTVDTHIKRLREKLGAAGDTIETVRGVGYRLGG